MANNHVNVIIVGAGAGGGVVAKELAESGLSVVLFERGGWPDYDKHINKRFLAVEDQGIGIPKEELEHVFDKYFRVRSEKSSRFEGVGLGLAACQKGLKVRFTTAAALVHELIEAADDRRLQKLLASQDLLIIHCPAGDCVAICR